MANGEVSADEAREMLNGWQEANARGECEAPHHRYDTEMTVCMCGPCSAKFSAHNSGGIAAPDLAATVIALHERVAELTRERDEARAIIAGRKVAPTPAEVIAHASRGGRWQCTIPNGGRYLAREPDAQFLAMAGCVWDALDHNDRPTAWPLVTP